MSELKQMLFLFMIPLGLGMIWAICYFLYIRQARNIYKQSYLNFKQINTNSSRKERLMKLYFNRQQTYEFSGYAILVIALLFLSACIILFIFSPILVRRAGPYPNAHDFWISLLSLRAGIALIVFFICQVLLRLYRYCVRFAVFYIGLFDALFIHEELNIDIKDAIGLFMQTTDIGDPPTSPSKELLEIVANLSKAKS